MPPSQPTGEPAGRRPVRDRASIALSGDHDMNRERPRLVYSTGPEDSSSDGAGSCPRCRRAPCRCAAETAPPPSTRIVDVRRETAGRRGKTVTVAGPFPLAPPEARGLLKSLRRECGSGGTLKTAPAVGGQAGWLLEIQGDHCERVIRRLADLGFRARRTGG